MSMFDMILKQVAGSPDSIADLAAKVGIDPKMAEMALAALGQSHAEPGDTCELAAKKTGMDVGAIGSILKQFGGEGALGDMVGKVQGAGGMGALSSMLDRDGDGSPINDIMGMAKGFLGGGKS